MALPIAANVTVDIFRKSDPTAPYPTGAAASSAIPGYLKPVAATGRHGTASFLKWTHILYLDSSVDIRDAYNSQFDPTRTNNNGDTVILFDTVDNTKKTAFYVVYVELSLKGTPLQHFRVYLDRFAPKQWPTDAL